MMILLYRYEVYEVDVYMAKRSPQCTYLLKISHVGEDAYALQSFAQTHFIRQDPCAQQWNTSGGSFDELPASCNIETPTTYHTSKHLAP